VDSVYEGVKSFYKETDETKPVNTYGETKVAAEKYIQANYGNYAILRSSIIYGPQPFVPLPKTLPVQVNHCSSSPEVGESCVLAWHGAQ
jgi:dTDP-4-dehydrorhamnose reductase